LTIHSVLFTVSVLHWVTSVDQDNHSTQPSDSNPSHTRPLCSPGPAWADGPIDSSLYHGQWTAAQYTDQNQTAPTTVNTEIITGSSSRGGSIVLDTLPRIKVQVEHKREEEVNVDGKRQGNSTNYIIEPIGKLSV
jgi:hypothetical protein